MYIRVRAFARILEDIHAAWATVLLFVTKGNTRASVSGTARLQSRFLCLYSGTSILEAPLFLYVYKLW